MNKRVFLIVLDSLGIGEAPDAHKFNDSGANTLKSISKSENFDINNLYKLGLFNIDGVDCLKSNSSPKAAYGKLKELSNGKDTVIGHWEIAGVISHNPMPTYPDGFPDEILNKFMSLTKRQILCNKPYSGTEVIKEFGQHHVETGDLIVYTSADSVFQIAAHEDVVPIDTLYEYCKIARTLLSGKHGVGRVIARPFIGNDGNFKRTSNRHDFSIEPPTKTMLDYLKDNRLDVIGIGKINDIFASKGITEFTYTKNNDDGMAKTDEFSKTNFNGLCFINLVDFDSSYGHRNDVDGYANALSQFDAWLGKFICHLNDNDILIITADHGCDPGLTNTTDHTREYTPLLVYGKKIKPQNLKTRNGFCDIAKTICEYFNVANNLQGNSFLGDIYDKQ